MPEPVGLSSATPSPHRVDTAWGGFLPSLSSLVPIVVDAYCEGPRTVCPGGAGSVGTAPALSPPGLYTNVTKIGPFTIDKFFGTSFLDYKSLSFGAPPTIIPKSPFEPVGFNAGGMLQFDTAGNFRVSPYVTGVPIVGGLSIGYLGKL
jgi:hypothetical protein